MSMRENQKLAYEVYKFSSYSSSYCPENIRDNQPHNQASRWSSDSNAKTTQFLILKLTRPAVVRQISFGKFEKPHVCNLKKFRIYGGIDENCNILLAEGGLKNDTELEKFSLKYKTATGEVFPIRFVQITPLLSWGSGFNFSIWYVELTGYDDPVVISSVLRMYHVDREAEIVRLCLKYFRQQGYSDAFRALQNQTKIRLEHPLLEQLFQILVIEGDFEKTEKQIESLVNDGLIDEYIEGLVYAVEWKQINTQIGIRPGKRGGHQLVMDHKNRLLYLYGGWNGANDLSDMWIFNLNTNQWTLVHENSEQVGGPSPRACHKMIFDTHTSQIFMLGRYVEAKNREYQVLKSDFYLFDTTTKSWLLICEDTADVGGPQLIFDHQMCIDVEKRMLYVFGGRVTYTTDDINQVFSGLYSYDISNNVWSLLFNDTGPRCIRSRITHSMLFHDKKRKIYIFGGQRDKQYLTDFIEYDVTTDTLTVSEHGMLDHPNSIDFPEPGLTTRATIDMEKDEIYVLTSLSKNKDRQEVKLNALWMFSLKKTTWTCIYRSDETDPMTQSSYPCPRYAHQLVYDPIERIHYLFGGNPGIHDNSEERLDDFWSLHLRRPETRENILRKCRLLIRTQMYENLTKIDPLRALQYLQTELYEVIDRSDKVQLEEFHKLATLLFKPATNEFEVEVCKSLVESMDESSSSSDKTEDNLYRHNIAKIARRSEVISRDQSRLMLYNRLLEFLPNRLCQPKHNLTDFILI